jgi:hypothetical protein
VRPCHARTVFEPTKCESIPSLKGSRAVLTPAVSRPTTNSRADPTCEPGSALSFEIDDAVASVLRLRRTRHTHWAETVGGAAVSELAEVVGPNAADLP